MKKRLLAIFLCLLLVLTLVLPAGADFGDFGGDSDYGDSDWGDSDWGGSDWGGSSWDDDDDDDFYFSSGDDFEFVEEHPILSIIILIVVIALGIYGKSGGGGGRRGGRKGGHGRNVPPGASRTNPSTLKTMTEYQKLDPGFDPAALQERISNLYVQMQNGWTAKDIEALRPYFTDALFTQMERQLNQKKQAHQTNYVQRIAVLGVDLKGFRQLNGQDHIIAEVKTRILDYTVDDNTGAVVSGSKLVEKYMTYEWDLCRAAGKTTGAEETLHRTTCPACGAPLEVNASARCPYCGTVLQAEASDWALCSIKGISQRTGL